MDGGVGRARLPKKTPHREAQTHFRPLKLDALVYIGECNLKLPFSYSLVTFLFSLSSNIHKFSDLS